MTTAEFRAQLEERARGAGVHVSAELADRLEIYFRLLARWNAKVNLTAFPLDNPTAEAFDRLFVEPLVAARFVQFAARRYIDIGSGGGSPAIPLACARTGTHLVMVESRARKAVFLTEALRAVGLPGEVVTARFQELAVRPEHLSAHDVLSIRAVRVEAGMLAELTPLLAPGGRMLLFRSTALEAITPPSALKIEQRASLGTDRAELVILGRA